MAEPTLWVGAVAYDPKVVTIWEGMRDYFRREARVPVDIVLFQSYEAQVAALLADGSMIAPRIDSAWNTNLAYLQSMEWSAGACRPIAMRDTDLGWTTRMIALAGGPVASLEGLRGHTLAVGSQDSGHAAILPLHFLEQAGLVADRDFTLLRFNTDVGKHGDTGTSEVDVLKAVLDGRADAGMVGSPFWAGVQEQRLVPSGAVANIWTSPPYTHCMFTARPGLDPAIEKRFADALYNMSFDNPAHRVVLEAEGLKQWLPAETSGYASLTEACRRQGHFRQAQ
ncbi:MAG: phosphate/phosphite/phosphonate ABC transporter substrate-binding protein [Vicinamibacterales bacterium]